ncbi:MULTISPECIES: hypothetical protein [Vibrio]|uniref:hypothetical protein n=1 Tax=Vibrio TaxID=662 RepID=UPI0008416FCC|nr:MULTISPECIES: hypothetical protein [Vibrio]ODM56969.1 hypothetical protein BC455_17915 [Vibrio harveyi]USD58686.1 hypothetical protein J4N44_27420 [Vibrio sp. SCSIO 43155]
MDQIKLIEHYKNQLQKVAISHGVDSQHYDHAYFMLRGARMGMDVAELTAWAIKQNDRLHKIALNRI